MMTKNLPRKVMVVGSGGREHALILKIYHDLCQLLGGSKSFELYALPGNPGMAKYATVFYDIDVLDIGAILTKAQELEIELVIIGPEGPLGLGLTDALEQAGIPTFGPNQKQAELELSKVRCKQLMWDYNIPTAPGTICYSLGEALSVAKGMAYPMVVKPDGGTGGKGVMICKSYKEAEKHIRAVMEGHIYEETGDKGEQIVLEECLIGREASITVFTHNGVWIGLPTAEDHKQRLEGDKGDMTGGIGAYSPSTIADGWSETIRRDIIEPLVKATLKEFGSCSGVLYIALMITADGPKVLEVNCRLGDPETQVVLPRVKTPLLPIMHQIAQGQLEPIELEVSNEHAVCVVMYTDIYPKPGYKTGQRIYGISRAEQLKGVTVYHAGTRQKSKGALVVLDGRVLGVTALGRTLTEARLQAYRGVGKIKFTLSGWRKDIAQRQN